MVVPPTPHPRPSRLYSRPSASLSHAGLRALCLGLALTCAYAYAEEAPSPSDEPEDWSGVIMLDPVLVETDRSGETQPTPKNAFDENTEAPFGNELLWDVAFDELPLHQLDDELAALIRSSPPPAVIAAGTDPLNFAGFPVQMRRDDFTSFGVPDILNVSRSMLVAGSLVPVYGRAVPGGIRDSQPARPGSLDRTEFGASAGTLKTWNAQARQDKIVTPKKTWSLLMANASGRQGPQDYASDWQAGTRAALSVRHNQKVSTLWSIDYQRAGGNPSPGILEYRANASGPILGPYRPLADFNAYGPSGDQRREILSAGLQYENQLSPELKLRSSLHFTRQESTQDTFTVGQLNLATGKLTGTREPRRSSAEHSAVNHETSLTRTFEALDGVHKPRLSLEFSQSLRDQETRSLLPADIAALPLDVRTFDPAAPNYSRPAYSPDLFQRKVTDQGISQRLITVGADTRSAFNRGATVFTVGAYSLLSDVSVSDRRVGASTPESSRENLDWNHHAGINQRLGRFVLVFANASAATSPMTQVDRRTGEIKDNSATEGVELGVRTLLLERSLSLAAIVHHYDNQNIPRRNPLYADPVLDANQTQPELVNSGEEQFRGLTTLIGYRPSPTWSGTFRATWTEATTTRSPDLPEEEGRQIQNFPKFSAALGLSYRPTSDLLKGVTISSNATHVGPYVRNYERTGRARVDFPSYETVGLSVGRSWNRKKNNHTLTLSFSNLFNEDLLEKIARLGGERSATLSWTVQL